ncbi:hypothetical protein Q5424_12105 [Conexibacter sp. JD483]|uniref:hypothetical protein n=1 Tax=unclassified Conexibacter TaxID=2627773 RepID=UPI00271D3122|nr:MULTISPECIES: hypothetical protein [unclassified Conexibacter]MDO8188063.1 hypothetical protein [Conexibacter sp. CPCC 205706]MDO8200485.1 hypothetical protein [Conexibacter sp. CPCC 205762]MDR9369832.1 hypothetical protein [Conexibacter sp. JD483]
MTLPRDDTAGKVNPEYARGELVRVLGVRNQIEGEFIQGLLLEEGVPSILRRSMGFDVPDFLASGPRDVMVPRSGVSATRDVLLQAHLLPDAAPAGPSPTKLFAVILLVLAVVAALIYAADAIF